MNAPANSESVFSRRAFQFIAASLISFQMILDALIFELFRFKVDSRGWKDQKCLVFNLSMPLIQKCCPCKKQSKMSHIVQNLTNFSSDIWCWIFPNFCLQHWFRLAKWFIAYSCSGPSFFTKNKKNDWSAGRDQNIRVRKHVQWSEGHLGTFRKYFRK